MDEEATTFQCSPALKRKPGETCIPPHSLHTIRRVWNRLHPEDPIRSSGTIGRRRRTRKVGLVGMGADTKAKGTAPIPLWKMIRAQMAKYYKCRTDFCVVDKMPGLSRDERENLKGFFRPAMPDAWKKKPTTWLDSFNIEDVMEQYEEAYPAFEFIGPVPIDFDAPDGAFGRCIVNELCKLNLADMEAAGTRQIGIIFNLDKHDEPGSHWVCAFIDITKSAAYYFDSYGYEAPEEVVRLFERLREQGIQHTYYNDVRHQRKGSECGMYCLYTIISLLLGRSFYDLCVNIVDDDTMNALRDVLFATETPRREAIERALKLLPAA
jgi:hypothetical protein